MSLAQGFQNTQSELDKLVMSLMEDNSAANRNLPKPTVALPSARPSAAAAPPARPSAAAAPPARPFAAVRSSQPVRLSAPVRPSPYSAVRPSAFRPPAAFVTASGPVHQPAAFVTASGPVHQPAVSVTASEPVYQPAVSVTASEPVYQPATTVTTSEPAMSQSITENNAMPVEAVLDEQPLDLSATGNHVEAVLDLTQEETKKKPVYEWKSKPVLLSQRQFDINPTGLKYVSVGNLWLDGFPTAIVLGKLDMANSFLIINVEEWQTFKMYFDVIDDYFKSAASPIHEVNIGTCSLKFRMLFQKPSLFICQDGGRFVIMSPVFERLKSITQLVDQSIILSNKTSKKLTELFSEQPTIDDDEDALLYMELVHADSLYKTE